MTTIGGSPVNEIKFLNVLLNFSLLIIKLNHLTVVKLMKVMDGKLNGMKFKNGYTNIASFKNRILIPVQKFKFFASMGKVD